MVIGTRDKVISKYENPAKVKTALIKHTIDINELDKEETVMVGDSEGDVIGGFNNRIQTIAVSWGFGSSDEFFYANSIFGSFETLGAYLLK